jgi:hypothetical protein
VIRVLAVGDPSNYATARGAGQRRIATRHTHHINSGCNGSRSQSPAMNPADACAARA